jgi:hypothetical protein
MATTFPTTIDTFINPNATDDTNTVSHSTQHTHVNDAVAALEAKVGADSSAVATSLDYKLKNSASISPGHKHTVTATDFSDVSITAVADGNVLTYDGASSKWKNSTTSAPDASTSVKGVTKMSVAPVSAVAPIAVGDNDGRVPTQAENDALVGNNTDVAVGTGNKFVTQTGAQHNAEKYAADAGASDTYVITLSPVPTSYTAGMVVYFKANTANTGAATLNVNSLGAKTIVKGISSTLDDGDIAAGQLCMVIYDGTNFVLNSPLAKTTYTNGVTTKDTTNASTTQSIAHGLGRIPKKISISASVAMGSGAYNIWRAKTVYNGTTQSSMSDTWASANPLNGISTSFQLFDNASTGNQAGVITVDATNINIAWTKTGSPTQTWTLLWEAEG